MPRPWDRGQLYVMLGLIGASAPPMFGLTSEQVRENSMAASPAGLDDPTNTHQEEASR